MPGVDSLLEGGRVFNVCVATSERLYSKRGVYNQQGIDPAGDVLGVVGGGDGDRRGKFRRASCSEEGSSIPMLLCAAPPRFRRLYCGLLLRAILTPPTSPWLCDGLYSVTSLYRDHFLTHLSFPGTAPLQGQETWLNNLPI